MVHRRSPAARQRRHARAALRGYVMPTPQGCAHVRIRSSLAPRLRRMADSLELHEAHNELSPQPFHYARDATLAARHALSDAEVAAAHSAHRAANRAKHCWHHPSSDSAALEPQHGDVASPIQLQNPLAEISNLVHTVIPRLESVVKTHDDKFVATGDKFLEIKDAMGNLLPHLQNIIPLESLLKTLVKTHDDKFVAIDKKLSEIDDALRKVVKTQEKYDVFFQNTEKSTPSTDAGSSASGGWPSEASPSCSALPPPMSIVEVAGSLASQWPQSEASESSPPMRWVPPPPVSLIDVSGTDFAASGGAAAAAPPLSCCSWFVDAGAFISAAEFLFLIVFHFIALGVRLLALIMKMSRVSEVKAAYFHLPAKLVVDYGQKKNKKNNKKKKPASGGLQLHAGADFMRSCAEFGIDLVVFSGLFVLAWKSDPVGRLLKSMILNSVAQSVNLQDGMQSENYADSVD